MLQSLPWQLPPPISSLPILHIFESHGFSVRDMVALTDAHTIGFSHCKEFASGIYNYSRSNPSYPAINPRFAEGLRSACKDFTHNPTISVFDEIMTPNKFDNSYYKNIQRGLGLLASDRALYSNSRTKGIVDEFARDENSFFAAAMEKHSVLGVKGGRHGEVRHMFAEGLRSACKDFTHNPTISVFNDIMTPNKFDNSYYKNIQRGLGLLASDRALYFDSRTKGIVDKFARDENSFFAAFTSAMEKLSVLGVKGGRHGEVRHMCDAFNN